MKMNVSDVENVLRFLRLARLRLWLLVCRREALRLGWILTAILLVVAAVHVTIAAVPATFIAVVASAIAIAAVLRALLVRPSLAESAVAADVAFDGRSIMTTALEICKRGPSPRDEAARIIMDQANEAATSWNQENLTVTDHTRSAATALTIVPLFAAVVLLLSPGADNSDVVPTTVAPRADRMSVTEDSGTAREDAAIEALRHSFAESRGEQRETFPASDVQQDVVGKQATDVARSADSLPALEQAATSGSSGALPGIAAPRVSTQFSSSAVQYFDRELVSIARTGTAQATSTDHQDQFSGTTLKTGGRVHSILPATPPSAKSQFSNLSYSQAAYAQRYLDASGLDND